MSSRQLQFDQPFEFAAAIDGAQDFRWRPLEDGWHSGVLAGHILHARGNDGGIEYRASSNLDGLIASYFRLDDDVQGILAEISDRDAVICELVRRYPNFRMLRQPDPWECTVAYICSANNSVGRIRTIVEGIAQTFGTPVELDGETRYTFPSASRLLDAGAERLKELRLGLNRPRKIIDAAERVCDGRVDLDCLSQPQVCYAEAKRRLMACHGIGGKIADCIALFALDKMEAFPVDTWIQKALDRLSRVNYLCLLDDN